MKYMCVASFVLLCCCSLIISIAAQQDSIEVYKQTMRQLELDISQLGSSDAVSLELLPSNACWNAGVYHEDIDNYQDWIDSPDDKQYPGLNSGGIEIIEDGGEVEELEMFEIFSGMASNLLQMDYESNHHYLYYLDWNQKLYSYSVQDSKDTIKFLGTKPIMFEIQPEGVISGNATVGAPIVKNNYKLIKLLQWKDTNILCVLDDLLYLIQGDKGEFVGVIEFLKDIVIIDDMLIVATGIKGVEMLEISIKQSAAAQILHGKDMQIQKIQGLKWNEQVMLAVSADKDTKRVAFASQTTVYVFALGSKTLMFVQSFEAAADITQIVINSQTIVLTHTRMTYASNGNKQQQTAGQMEGKLEYGYSEYSLGISLPNETISEDYNSSQYQLVKTQWLGGTSHSPIVRPLLSSTHIYLLLSGSMIVIKLRVLGSQIQMIQSNFLHHRFASSQSSGSAVILQSNSTSYSMVVYITHSKVLLVKFHSWNIAVQFTRDALVGLHTQYIQQTQNALTYPTSLSYTFSACSFNCFDSLSAQLSSDVSYEKQVIPYSDRRASYCYNNSTNKQLSIQSNSSCIIQIPVHIVFKTLSQPPYSRTQSFMVGILAAVSIGVFAFLVFIFICKKTQSKANENANQLNNNISDSHQHPKHHSEYCDDSQQINAVVIPPLSTQYLKKVKTTTSQQATSTSSSTMANNTHKLLEESQQSNQPYFNSSNRINQINNSNSLIHNNSNNNNSSYNNNNNNSIYGNLHGSSVNESLRDVERVGGGGEQYDDVDAQTRQILANQFEHQQYIQYIVNSSQFQSLNRKEQDRILNQQYQQHLEYQRQLKIQMIRKGNNSYVNGKLVGQAEGKSSSVVDPILETDSDKKMSTRRDSGVFSRINRGKKQIGKDYNNNNNYLGQQQQQFYSTNSHSPTKQQLGLGELLSEKKENQNGQVHIQEQEQLQQSIKPEDIIEHSVQSISNMALQSSNVFSPVCNVNAEFLHDRYLSDHQNHNKSIDSHSLLDNVFDRQRYSPQDHEFELQRQQNQQRSLVHDLNEICQGKQDDSAGLFHRRHGDKMLFEEAEDLSYQMKDNKHNEHSVERTEDTMAQRDYSMGNAQNNMQHLHNNNRQYGNYSQGDISAGIMGYPEEQVNQNIITAQSFKKENNPLINSVHTVGSTAMSAPEQFDCELQSIEQPQEQQINNDQHNQMLLQEEETHNQQQQQHLELACSEEEAEEEYFEDKNNVRDDIELQPHNKKNSSSSSGASLYHQ